MHYTTFLKSENFGIWPEGFRSGVWVCISRVEEGIPGAGAWPAQSPGNMQMQALRACGPGTWAPGRGCAQQRGAD